MGPGQSMAMAGNTGLAGISEKEAVQAQQAIRDFNKDFAQKPGDKFYQDPSFTAMGQRIGELGSKLRAPIGVSKYIGGQYTPADFDAGGQFRPFLPKFKPSLGQVLGYAGSALGGYDTLKYQQPGVAGSGITSISVPGMPLPTPTGIAAFAIDKFKQAKSKSIDTLSDIKKEILKGGEKAFRTLFPEVKKEVDEDVFQSLVPKEIDIQEDVSIPVYRYGGIVSARKR